MLHVVWVISWIMSELCHSACMLFCLFDFPASLHHLLPACPADQLTQQSDRVLHVCYIMSGMQKHKLKPNELSQDQVISLQLFPAVVNMPFCVNIGNEQLA